MIADTDWAYLAGIIDGEGTISATCPSKRYYYPRLQVVQKYPSILIWLHTTFGGQIYTGPNISNWKLTSRSRVEPVLENIIPFLVMKQDLARCALSVIRSRESIEEHVKFGKRVKELRSEYS